MLLLEINTLAFLLFTMNYVIDWDYLFNDWCI